MNPLATEARGHIFIQINLELLFLTQYQTSYDGTDKYVK